MLPGTLSYQRLLLLFASIWLIWATLHAAALHYVEWDWTLAIVDSLVSNFMLAAICFATVNALRYYQPGKSNWQNMLLWSVTLSGIWLLAVHFTLSSIYVQNQDYLGFLKQSLPVRYGIAFLMTGWVVLLTWLWRYIAAQKETEQRKSHTEKLSKEAELANLRQQLQPHFLFNSLNSISALVVRKPEEARKMIQQLSDFLRGTLKKDEQQQVTLTEELQQLQLYLDIEKVRFGHRLNTAVNISEEAESLKLPALLLQPVVENAIKFGLYDTTDSVMITIKAEKLDHYLTISIENPFDSETAQPRHGTGFGLKSIQRRLYLLYARNDLLETSSNNNLFTATIKIPQQA